MRRGLDKRDKLDKLSESPGALRPGYVEKQFAPNGFRTQLAFPFVWRP